MINAIDIFRKKVVENEFQAITPLQTLKFERGIFLKILSEYVDILAYIKQSADDDIKLRKNLKNIHDMKNSIARKTILSMYKDVVKQNTSNLNSNRKSMALRLKTSLVTEKKS